MAARSKDRSPAEAGPVTGVHKIETDSYRTAREAARDILELIHNVVGLRICVLTHVDLAANTLTVLEAFDRAGVGVESGQTLPADAMPCACVVRTETALREYDLDAVEPFRRLPACTKLGLRSYIGVPLRRSDGSIWGTLVATDTELKNVTDADVQTLVSLARLIVLEFEREEQRDALTERIAMAEALEEERLRAARFQAVLEAVAGVSHEINNPLTVLQLRLGWLAKRLPPEAIEAAEDLAMAREAAGQIQQVTTLLRSMVRPVSTQYVSGTARMIDLTASAKADEGARDPSEHLASRSRR
jgi:signal transduction histidine kinase